VTAWILIAAGKSLFAEFDQIAPGRGHASDGSIGDTAHQHEVSDHNPDETGSVPVHDADHINEVHAIDVDNDLREPGLDMEQVVQFLLGRCRSGAEKRLRYIIYNRRIWEADNGWRQRSYTGPSPHTEHAHFSLSYTTSLEASTASWHLEDIPVALTTDDKKWITGQLNAVKDDFLNVKIGDDAYPGRTVGQLCQDVAKLRGVLVGDGKDTANAKLPAGSPLARLIAAADDILAQAPATPGN
jgi:hypothetical protein